MKYEFIISGLIAVGLICICLSTVAEGLIYPDETYWTTGIAVSSWNDGIKSELIIGRQAYAYFNATIDHAFARLRRVTSNEEAKMIIYDENFGVRGISEERIISYTAVGGTWYQFNFTTYPIVNQSEYFYICIYADAPNVDPTGRVQYVQLSSQALYKAVSIFNTTNNYGVVPDYIVNPSFSYSSSHSMYVQLNWSVDSNDLSIINNSFNVSGIIDSRYNNSEGWHVWVNQTGNSSSGFIEEQDLFMSIILTGVAVISFYSIYFKPD